MQTLDDLRSSRYALLRSYRRDGIPVDTPIWFAFDGSTLVFRTKIGPKTRRLTRDPRVQLQVYDHRGRVGHDGTTADGRASILDGAAADAANELLRRRYGWQYNVVPLLKIPGVRNVHSNLPWREKLRRARDRGLWNDSAIVRIDL
ncbi:PPOX class F420-dependent oxidoreductase [Mycobacterium sp. NPDC050551]|uniref:PPOX class F420-dependent oxidoreductase n=1 Tax=Mycobacterium sp. NPDC050551 TaxID=3155407 RepID=UPI00341F87A5